MTAAKLLAELDKLTSNETTPSAVEIATWFALRLPIIRAALSSAAPAPAAEPVAWALLEDLNLVQLERMAVEKEASDEQRIPCFISVEWVQRAVAAWRNAAPQPAQAEEEQ